MSKNIKQVKNHLNVQHFEKTVRIFTEPSQTVPDQTMSIRTIMERHVRGISTPAVKSPIYSDGDGINPKSLDLVDIQRIRMEHQETLDRIEKDYQAARDKKAYDKAKKQAETDLNKALAEKAENEKSNNPT